MKDLDFDELDRAVNSLIQGAPTETKPQEVERVVDIPTASIPYSSNDDPKASPLASRRSSGQFMDVVHPSSNMRKMPIAVPKRPQLSNSSSSDKSQKLTETNRLNSWDSQPDSVEPKADEVSYKSEPYVADDIDKIADSINDTLIQSNDDALVSPFISDAKVEKRPLGAFSDAPFSLPEPSAGLLAEMEKESIVDSKTAEINSELPAELQDALLQIEDRESTESGVVDAPAPDKEPDAQQNEEPIASAEQPVTEVASINQQYAEQPSTGDQNSGAIYDTDAYHKALVKPAKKKSGWLWIVWTVVLVALGIGAGVAVYMLKIL